MRLKLFTKFVLFLFLISVLPAAWIGVRTININREGMQAAILELHTHLASSLADYVQDYLQGLEREIQYVLRTLGAQMNWSDRQSVLQSLLDTNENFVSVSIVDKKGQELLKAYNPALEKDPRLVSHAGDSTFTDFWKADRASRSALSPVYLSGDDPRMNIVYPLGAEHCLYATVTLARLRDKITQTRIASTGYAFLVDEKGRVIVHPDPATARSRRLATNLPSVTQVLKAVTVGSSEYVHPEKKEPVVGAHAPVKGLNWGIVIQQDKDEAYVSVSRMRKQAIALIVISLAAAAGLALFIARTLTRPLVNLTHAARHVAQKDFTVRVSVKTHDELRDLAETFNDMTAELQHYDRMQVDKIVEEKTKTDAVIFSIADGLVMTDREGKLQLANNHARRILGIPQSGWQDMPLWHFVKNPHLREAFEEIVKQPGRSNDREIELQANNLSQFFNLSTQEVVTPERNEKIGLVTVIRNITLEKELNTMKDDFLHSITHDLRNPMTSIRGFLKFLLDGVGGPITEQQKKMLETMDRASHRLLRLINDILDIAKLESGRMTLNLTPVDLRHIAQRTIEIAEGQAMKKSITLTLDAPAELPAIQGDAELLERVFTNLVSNALKFTPENGKVMVRIREQEGSLETAVIDNGEGIPPEYLNKIFNKFQQVAGQSKGGTGLGLTICKHIVESHLGSIRVESKLGEGATFIFTLPRDLTADRLMTRTASPATNNDQKPA